MVWFSRPKCLLAGALLASFAACSAERRVEGPATVPVPDDDLGGVALPALPARSFDVPRVDGLVIDGKTADWGERGLRLEVLTASDPDARDPGTFDATARLAWDDEGLVFRVDVVDATPSESSMDDALYERDSLEFFVATAVGSPDSVQFIVAPGVDPAHPMPRQTFVEHRSNDALKETRLPVAFARTKSASGYSAEARVPWKLLDIAPAVGREIGVQLYVNDEAAGTRQKLVWFPRDGAYDDKNLLHRVHLAAQPSKPVTLVASGTYQGFRSTRVDVTAVSVDQSPLKIVAGSAAVGRIELHPRGRLGMGRIDVPIAAPGEVPDPLLILGNRGDAVWIELPDLLHARRLARDALKVVARPSVFSGADFPNIEFENPEGAEAVLGRYTLSTTFYDAAHRPVAKPAGPGRYGAVVDVKPERSESFRRRITLFRTPERLRYRDAKITASATLPKELGVAAEVLAQQGRSVGDLLMTAIGESIHHGSGAAIVLARLHEAPAGSTFDGTNDAWATDERWWHELRRKTGDLEPYRYVVDVPPQAAREPNRTWPTILFLHGAGERGSDLGRVRRNGPPARAKELGEAFGFIVVAPLCPEGVRWEVPLLEDLMAEVRQKYPVDPDRVYLTGLSMGGYGTWRLASAHPDWFAAAAPICGGGDPRSARRLHDLPTWVVHGAKDALVPVERSTEMVTALRALHGRVRFSLYPEGGHDVWTRTYAGGTLYQWFLEQRRGRPAQRRATRTGSEPDERL